MKFFDRDWTEGYLSDAESDARREGYAAHLELLRAVLPEPLVDLSQAGVLHDALFEAVSLDLGSARLVLELIGGDKQVGYCGLRLQYDGIVLDAASHGALKQAACDPATEWLYDELHLSGDGRFVHRLLLWPSYQPNLVFERFAVASTPRSGRALRPGAPTYQQVGARPA
jgi:hypothetical protein